MKYQPEPEINLGALVCDMLKSVYFKNIPWIDCYKLVAAKFTELKVIMRKFYPDKTIIEILQEVSKYSTQDIKDIFG